MAVLLMMMSCLLMMSHLILSLWSELSHFQDSQPGAHEGDQSEAEGDRGQEVGGGWTTVEGARVCGVGQREVGVDWGAVGAGAISRGYVVGTDEPQFCWCLASCWLLGWLQWVVSHVVSFFVLSKTFWFLRDACLVSELCKLVSIDASWLGFRYVCVNDWIFFPGPDDRSQIVFQTFGMYLIPYDPAVHSSAATQ